MSLPRLLLSIVLCQCEVRLMAYLGL